AFAVAGQHLQDREDDVLLAGAGDAVGDLQLLGDVQQLRRRHALEVAQGIGGEAFRHLRVRARHERLAVAAVVRHAAVAVALALAVAAVLEALAAARALAVVALLRAVLAGLRLGVGLVVVAAGGLGGRGCGRRLGGCRRRWCGRGRRSGGRRVVERRDGQRFLAGGLGHAGLAHALGGGFAGVVGGI